MLLMDYTTGYLIHFECLSWAAYHARRVADEKIDFWVGLETYFMDVNCPIWTGQDSSRVLGWKNDRDIKWARE